VSWSWFDYLTIQTTGYPPKGREMGEPKTEAGRRLDLAWPGTHLDRLDWQAAILAIEQEARRAALDEVLALRYPWPDHFGTREAAGWNSAFEAVLANLRADPVPPQSEGDEG